MTDWNKNNRACAATWMTLRVLDQNDKVFKESGDVRMEELTFWNQLGSEEMRSIQARTLAIQIDNIFRSTWKAGYEKGVDNQKAVTDTWMALTSATATIAELAQVIDNNYLFWGEENEV